MEGKDIRLQRLIRNKKIFCVPLDHGITTDNIGNLIYFEKTFNDIVHEGITSVILHKGMLRYINSIPSNIGIIIHLSASTNMNCEVKKILVCSVREAISLGADAVSIHINFSNKYEKDMLKDFALISNECKKYGIPLIAMVYIRNDNNEDISTPQATKHAIRIATELGADIVKIKFNKTWNIKVLYDIVETTPLPIIVAGGDLYPTESELIQNTKNMLASGIVGISYGRNIFMAENPKKIVRELSDIINN